MLTVSRRYRILALRAILFFARKEVGSFWSLGIYPEALFIRLSLFNLLQYSHMEAEINSVNPTVVICPVCHQSILPVYYFCPNCGAKINSSPLKTTLGAQIGLYLWTIILPLICFITISRWSGLKYLRSQDPKAKLIGLTALVLLIVSTVGIYWYATVEIQNYVQSFTNSLNADLGNITF